MWKTSRQLEWYGFVCFAVDEENCREPAKQQRRVGNRTRCKLKLWFFLSYFVFYLSLISLSLFHFVHSEQTVRVSVVLELPHILTHIIFLTNVFTNKLILRFRCHFAVCSGKFLLFGKTWNTKRLPKWWMSQYVYIMNTIPHGKRFVRYFRTRCFCIRNRTSEHSEQVRFLIQKQRVRKYRTPALSMKYSVFILEFSWSEGPF